MRRSLVTFPIHSPPFAGPIMPSASYRRAFAWSVLILGLPSMAVAQMPAGDTPPATPPVGSAPIPTAPTLSEVLSHPAFDSLRTADGRSLGFQATAPTASQSLQANLRQRLHERLQQRSAEWDAAGDRSLAKLKPVAPQGEDVALEPQQASWRAYIAGDIQKAAAHLHDALLLGGPATQGQLHRWSGGKQEYLTGFHELVRRADTAASKAEAFLLAYHAAVQGERQLALAALSRLDEAPQPAIHPLVRLRIRQLLP